jgi:hypothetical protein
LSLGAAFAKEDQRKAGESGAREERAPFSAPCWTRHHDIETPANSGTYAADSLAGGGCARGKKSLTELKRLWLMSG